MSGMISTILVVYIYKNMPARATLGGSKLWK